MAKKFIIDGAPGSGKTTILFGKTKDDSADFVREGISSKGYKVFSETGPIVMQKIALEGKGIDKEKIFHLIMLEEIKKHKAMTKEKGVCFCDRSLLGFLPIATIHSDQALSNEFFKYCRKLKYDNPVFILEPISSLDLSKPIKGHNIRRIFTLDERKKIHNTLVALYQVMGYDVVIIPEDPSGTDDIEKNIKLRINLILKAVKAKK